MTFDQILAKIDDFVWGVPLIVLILAAGLLLTIRTGFIQVRHLPRALRYLFKEEVSEEEEIVHGEVSGFASLCTALSATIGTGNIVGVATAVGILAGGPGALFWMWVAAFLGMATKYSEGFLAVKYRTVDEDGHVLGGPFYYIEKGMGVKWKWLAKIFAFFGACVGLMGIGTFSQVNGIASAVTGFFDPNKTNTITLFGNDYSIVTVISAFVLAILAGLVIIGGLKRISSVSGSCSFHGYPVRSDSCGTYHLQHHKAPRSYRRSRNKRIRRKGYGRRCSRCSSHLHEKRYRKRYLLQ